jgi:hypothetical protein
MSSYHPRQLVPPRLARRDEVEMNELKISELILACTSGPDQGKRLVIRQKDVVIGRHLACDLISDDPDVAERHLKVSLRVERPWFQTIADAPVFVDGHRVLWRDRSMPSNSYESGGHSGSSAICEPARRLADGSII